MGESFNFGLGPEEGVFFWQIDVLFAMLKKKLLITFLSIVQRQGFYGSCFLLSLKHLGFFPLWLKRHSLSGMGPSWVKFTKSIRRLPHYVSFGLFGRKGTC